MNKKFGIPNLLILFFMTSCLETGSMSSGSSSSQPSTTPLPVTAESVVYINAFSPEVLWISYLDGTLRQQVGGATAIERKFTSPVIKVIRGSLNNLFLLLQDGQLIRADSNNLTTLETVSTSANSMVLIDYAETLYSETVWNSTMVLTVPRPNSGIAYMDDGSLKVYTYEWNGSNFYWSNRTAVLPNLGSYSFNSNSKFVGNCITLDTTNMWCPSTTIDYSIPVDLGAVVSGTSSASVGISYVKPQALNMLSSETYSGTSYYLNNSSELVARTLAYDSNNQLILDGDGHKIVNTSTWNGDGVGVKQIAGWSYNYGVCMLLNNGDVYCLGNVIYQYIPNSSVVDIGLTPVKMTGLSGASQIFMDGAICAVIDNQVKCATSQATASVITL